MCQARGGEAHREGSQEDQGEKLQQKAKQHEEEELKMRNRGLNAHVFQKAATRVCAQSSL